MSDPRGWNEHKDAIEAAKQELLTELGLLGDKATLDKIYALLGQGMTAQCVKSVQYQTVTISKSGGTDTTFTISEIDTSKCMVLPFHTGYGGSGQSYGACVWKLESTSVTIATSQANSSATYLSIFVIEFY